MYMFSSHRNQEAKELQWMGTPKFKVYIISKYIYIYLEPEPIYSEMIFPEVFGFWVVSHPSRMYFLIVVKKCFTLQEVTIQFVA